MGTSTRAKLSTKNKYYIDKHRYYELKHFCLQYSLWKFTYGELDGLKGQSFGDDILYNTKEIGDPTYTLAAERISYFNRMKLVEQAAFEADPELAKYILMAVTKSYSYNYMRMNLDMPCCKDVYYDRYRRFFWILDKKRD